MNYLLLILLTLLFILVVLRFFVVEEGFQNIQLQQTTINNYNRFKDFYNKFMTNWEKAVISSAVADMPQEPLSSPSEAPTGEPPKPSRNDMNLYVVALAKKINKQLPPVTDLVPEQVDANTLPVISQNIPQDPKLFINALEWMNENLEKSQSDLGSALRGGSIETFQSQCDDISKCIANNPELLNKLAEAQRNQAAQNLGIYEQTLSSKVNKLFSAGLNKSYQRNQQLVKQAEETQRRAESGEMINDINVPEGRSKATYIKSPNDESMKNLQQTDPQKYNQLKKSNPQWFAVKQLIEQINSTL
jgi:hypothetical protein